MRTALPDMLGSKKFLAALAAAILAYMGVREGFSEAQIAFVVGPLVAYIGAQGLADIGKEAESIRQEHKEPDA